MKLVRVRVSWIIIIVGKNFFHFINRFVFSAELDKPTEIETKSDAKIKVVCMFYLFHSESAVHIL